MNSQEVKEYLVQVTIIEGRHITRISINKN